MTVSDLMREEVVTVTPDRPVPEVATEMHQQRVGSVVVVDGTRPVGIVTDRDVAVRVVAEGRDAGALTAADVMTEDPETVDVETGIFELANAMYDASVRRIPVVEDGDLAGIVALDDLTVLLTGELQNLAGVIEAESPTP